MTRRVGLLVTLMALLAVASFDADARRTIQGPAGKLFDNFLLLFGGPGALEFRSGDATIQAVDNDATALVIESSDGTDLATFITTNGAEGITFVGTVSQSSITLTGDAGALKFTGADPTAQVPNNDATAWVLETATGVDILLLDTTTGAILGTYPIDIALGGGATALRFTSASTVLLTTSLDFEDASANDLMVLTDGGTTGTLNVTGTLQQAGVGVVTTARLLTGGTGIAVVGDLSADRTVTLDLTELATAVLGAGTFTTLTFDAGAIDPVLTAGSGSLDLTTGTLKQGGTAVVVQSRTLTGGAGITALGDLSADRTIATDSTEAGFLAGEGGGALSCGISNAGKMHVRTTGVLEWCDDAATPTVRNVAGFGATIDDTELSNEDFGSVTCTGAEDGCTVDGGYVATVADGTGIDGTATGQGSTYTPVFDPTEVTGSRTWGDASTDTIVWTWDRLTAGDPAITFGGGNVNVTTGTLQQGGTAVALSTVTLTAGAGLSGGGDISANRSFATASSEADFLASGALTCGTATQGKAQVHTTPLQYCDNAATPALKYAAYGDSAGAATEVTCTGCVADTELTANYSGVGDCGAGNFARTLNDNATPTCAADDDVPEAADYSALTCGAGLLCSPTGTVLTASEEAAFLKDGGVTSLTCGASAEGKAQVLDGGNLEWCDGAATSVLQTAATLGTLQTFTGAKTFNADATFGGGVGAVGLSVAGSTISCVDNSATACSLSESPNAYLTLDTTNGAEGIAITGYLKRNGTNVALESRTLTGGAGIAAIGDFSADRTVATDSTEAAFLADGGVTSLTCGASAGGKAQVLDSGVLEWCDGAGTSVLRSTAGFGASIDDTEMTSEDFGSFTCTAAEDGCTLDASSVGTANITDGTVACGDTDNGAGANGVACEGGTLAFTGTHSHTADVTMTGASLLFGAASEGIDFPDNSATAGSITAGTLDYITFNSTNNAEGISLAQATQVAAPLTLTADSETIASTGDANPATLTYSVMAGGNFRSTVIFTCNDPDTCDITMAETSVPTGTRVTMTNVSTNACDFVDSATVTELAGAFPMGQYDTLELVYITDRWHEVGRSDN